MNIHQFCLELFSDWKKKLQFNEWYFVRLENDFLTNLPSEDAFRSIPDLVDIILEQPPFQNEDDQFMYAELLSILVDLVQKSATTEIPQRLVESLEPISVRAQSLDINQRKPIKDIRDWYRLEAVNED